MARNDDAQLLAAYRDAQAYMAKRIRELGGDPERPTREQALTIAEELVARAQMMKALFDPEGPALTAEGAMRDHRKIQRLQKRGNH